MGNSSLQSSGLNMRTLEYIAPTERRPMTKQRRVRIFLSRNGICCLCGRQIRAHAEEWFVEHPLALNLGGSDDDSELHPAHVKCKPEKDRADAALIAKRNTAIDKTCADRPKKSRPFPGSRTSGWKKKFNGTTERRT